MAVTSGDSFGEAPWQPRPAPRRDRPRPTPRTFLIRRLTALGILLVVVLALVALVKALAGGDAEPEPGTPAAAAPRGAPAVPVRRTTTLDRLVAPDRALAPGATGAAVRGLQQALAVLGEDPGPVDGVFSDGTRAALVAFQGAHGLPASGTLDPATADGLREALTLWAAERTETIRAGLAAAQERGDLEEDALGDDVAIVMEAALQLPRLPPDRAAALSAVMADVAAQASVYDGPRATALVGMVDVNARRLAAGPLPAHGTDVRGTDGTVYRYITDHGYTFHPLANFARLNRYVARKQPAKAKVLAAALEARAVPDGDGLVWEYYFPFGGPARWTSALAQSAAAQAFMRTADAIGSDSAAEAAKGAFEAVPEDLARPLAGGTWVREYSWSDIAILNAQLQSLVSLSEYAEAAGDEDATAFTAELSKASQAMLPSLDTGDWSRYSIDGSDASEHYHCYHVDLLRRLADADPGTALWEQYRRRWQGYADARGGCPG